MDRELLREGYIKPQYLFCPNVITLHYNVGGKSRYNAIQFALWQHSLLWASHLCFHMSKRRQAPSGDAFLQPPHPDPGPFTLQNWPTHLHCILVQALAGHLLKAGQDFFHSLLIELEGSVFHLPYTENRDCGLGMVELQSKVSSNWHDGLFLSSVGFSRINP